MCTCGLPRQSQKTGSAGPADDVLLPTVECFCVAAYCTHSTVRPPLPSYKQRKLKGTLLLPLVFVAAAWRSVKSHAVVLRRCRGRADAAFPLLKWETGSEAHRRNRRPSSRIMPLSASLRGEQAHPKASQGHAKVAPAMNNHWN